MRENREGRDCLQGLPDECGDGYVGAAHERPKEGSVSGQRKTAQIKTEGGETNMIGFSTKIRNEGHLLDSALIIKVMRLGVEQDNIKAFVVKKKEKENKIRKLLENQQIEPKLAREGVKCSKTLWIKGE